MISGRREGGGTGRGRCDGCGRGGRAPPRRCGGGGGRRGPGLVEPRPERGARPEEVLAERAGGRGSPPTRRLAVATGAWASACALRHLRVLPTCGVGGWRGWEDVRPECQITRGRERATNLGSGTDRGKSLRAARPLRPEHPSVSRVGPRGPLTEDARQDRDSRSTKTTLAPYLALAWAQTPGACARFSFLTLPHNRLRELTKPWVPGPHPKGSDGGSLTFRLRPPFLKWHRWLKIQVLSPAPDSLSTFHGGGKGRDVYFLSPSRWL